MSHSKNVGKGGSKASNLKPVSGSQEIETSRKQGQGKIVFTMSVLNYLGAWSRNGRNY